MLTVFLPFKQRLCLYRLFISFSISLITLSICVFITSAIPDGFLQHKSFSNASGRIPFCLFRHGYRLPCNLVPSYILPHYFQFLIHCAEWTLAVFVKCIINGNRIYLSFILYSFYVYCLHNRQGRRHSLRQPLLNSLIVSYCMHKCYLHFYQIRD